MHPGVALSPAAVGYVFFAARREGSTKGAELALRFFLSLEPHLRSKQVWDGGCGVWGVGFGQLRSQQVAVINMCVYLNISSCVRVCACVCVCVRVRVWFRYMYIRIDE